ncbi:MAG: HAMP domain-containing histidine kinase [Oscillospiraceae bacterium]|nr:HAMP domain-containing histidine kinase [Oscillospiraceae bacterium]
MIKRLRLKIIVTIMTMVTITLCAIFGLIYYFTQSNLQNESLNMLQSLASNSFAPGLGTEQVRLPYFTVELTRRGDILTYENGYDLSDEELLDQLIQLSTSSDSQTGTIREYALRYYRTETPGGQLLIFADISSELSSLSSLLRTCLLLGVLSFLVFLAISILLARWVVKPVERAWDQQRQFVADASHELKTPLTVIMTNSELLQSQEFDEDSRQQFSANILTMAQQMRRLVEQLLELARLDNAQLGQSANATLSFSELVSDAVMPFEPVFFEQGLTLTCQIDEGCTLRGSESHLRQVVDVLLDNAQKYAFPNPEVSLILKKHGLGRCLLSVANQGEDIAPEDLVNIFRRFYRGDQARSRTGSFGLGLPIAQRIVQEHHGRIWAESCQGLNTFFVELPLAGEQSHLH